MSIAIRSVLGSMIATIVLPGMLLAQSKSDEAPLKPVTVCEVLANPQLFDGKNLAVLGRFSFTDEGRWLGEDNCEKKLVLAGGRTWPNIIWLHCCYEPAPDPPSGTLVLDHDVLDRKLQQVKKTTQLKYQQRHVHSVAKDGDTQSAESWRGVKDEWAVAYGRLEVVGEITPPQQSIIPGPRLWNHGFGHLGAAPVQLVVKEKNLRTIPDPATPEPSERREN